MYLCVGLFGLGLGVFCVQLHPRVSYLTLTQDCFVFSSLFRAHEVR